MRTFNEIRTTTNRRVYKMLKRFYDLDCTYCPPHRRENGHWYKPRKKKAYQLDPQRRHKLL